jgi:hypothetical protein
VAQKRVRYYARRYYMTYISSNGLRFMILFITGSMLLSSLTGCGVYKDWKQKEETRLMQTTREAIARENAERKAEKEANKNWLQRHWAGVSIETLATWAVGITTFMIFKWPMDGKQGKQGPKGAPGEKGEDGESIVPKGVLSQIQQNTNDVVQLQKTVFSQGKAIGEARDLAETAKGLAQKASTDNSKTDREVNAYRIRIQNLENGVSALQRNAN